MHYGSQCLTILLLMNNYVKMKTEIFWIKPLTELSIVLWIKFLLQINGY